MSARPSQLLLALLAFLVFLPAPAPAQEDDEDPRLVRLLGAGWAFLESRSLRKAEESFSEALRLPDGKGKAEVYYALAALWWEKRNALASYNWLKEGITVREQESWRWNAGEDGGWDRRIDGRVRYIERNFTVVKLSLEGGKRLPPMADPPPADPLLASFAEHLPRIVGDGVEADASNLFLLLPNGLYWVGDAEQVLNSGELEAHKAETWVLSSDRGGPKKRYAEHTAAIDRARSEKDDMQRRRDEARVAAQKAKDRRAQRQQEPRATPTPAAVSADGPQRPIVHRIVTADRLTSVSEDISARWTAGTFYVNYVVTCPDRYSMHEIDFPDLGFLVRFENGGDIKVRGDERLNDRLEGDWIVGEVGNPNYVQMWFDGKKLRLSVNAVELKPVTVVRAGTAEGPIGKWIIRLSDPRSEIQHLRIEPLVHSAVKR
jgi:hypothetical protein